MGPLESVVAGALLLLFIALGLVMVLSTVGDIRTAWAIARAAHSDAGSVSPGPVGVTGEIHSQAPLTGPVSGEECVAYELKYGVGREYSRGPGSTYWLGGRTVPFTVRDGTGEVRVDPAEGGRDGDGPEWTDGHLTSGLPSHFSRPASDRLRVEPGEDLPDDVAAALEAMDGDSNAPDRIRRFRERRLEPGEEVYVLGTAVQDEGMTIENHEGERFVVSTQSERRTAVGTAVRAVGSLLVGSALIAGSGWLLAGIL